MHKSLVKLLLVAVAALLALPPSALAQGITTAALTGTVTDKQGAPVAGATVTILHEPSGTRTTAVSRANGQYFASNLRVGGPYTVTASAPDYKPGVSSEVELSLGETQQVNLSMVSEVLNLEAFKVTADRDTTFGIGKTGTGSTFDANDISNTSSVRRNVQDVARIDSRLFLGSLDQGGQLSAQGQNFRQNSFLIDGVQANDSFGLTSNGFSTIRSPIPLEAIEQLSVELSPVDARKAGFTGALINAVTKSGTNKFHGGVYYEKTDQDLRAKNPVTSVRDVFKEHVLGYHLGGPIIKDRLFFFGIYEDFERVAAPPNQNFVPSAANVAAIVTRANSFNNYNPGGFTASNKSFQKTFLGKIDWNISHQHRANLTYRKIEGSDTTFQNFSGSTATSFDSNWYDNPRVTKALTGKIFSTWTPDLHTELTYSESDFDGSPKSRSPSPFPQVGITNVTGVTAGNGATITNGSVTLGTEVFRQLNFITTKTKNASLVADYSRGDHTFVAGADYEKTDIRNTFLPNYFGTFSFTSVANWVSGTASSLTQAVFAPGSTVNDVIATFGLGNYGIYIQDTWKPTSRLSIVAGIRIDWLDFANDPTAIPTTPNYSEASFRAAFGIPSTTSANGNYSYAPRLGFTYDLNTERKTQIFGNVGLFQGRSPAVYLSNAYSNRGVSATVTTNNVVFSPSFVTAGFNNTAVAQVNVTDPDFKQPVTWKGTIGIDHALPFGGLIASAALNFVNVDRGLFTTDLNLREVGTLPDGRIRYAGVIVATGNGSRGSSNSNPYNNNAFYTNAGFSDVFKLTNTNKGGGTDVTLALRRPLKNNWAASISWTRSHYTEVSPSTSSTAISNYNNRAIFNPNEDVASISNTNIPDRIVVTLLRRFEFVKKAPTTISLLYEGRSGHPYSWVFSRDANGDGFTFNDLLYVPNGANDTRVRFANTTERDAFFAFAANSGLNKYAGRVAPRNSETSPWNNNFDLKFTQTIPIYKNVSTEFYLNILNLGNLLNKKWGLLEEIPFSYRRAVVGTTYDAAANNGAGQYVYSFNSGTLNAIPITTFGATPESRWQIQLGARLKF